jgi:hypothetical protein
VQLTALVTARGHQLRLLHRLPGRAAHVAELCKGDLVVVCGTLVSPLHVRVPATPLLPYRSPQVTAPARVALGEVGRWLVSKR